MKFLIKNLKYEILHCQKMEIIKFFNAKESKLGNFSLL